MKKKNKKEKKKKQKERKRRNKKEKERREKKEKRCAYYPNFRIDFFVQRGSTKSGSLPTSREKIVKNGEIDENCPQFFFCAYKTYSLILSLLLS